MNSFVLKYLMLLWHLQNDHFCLVNDSHFYVNKIMAFVVEKKIFLESHKNVIGVIFNLPMCYIKIEKVSYLSVPRVKLKLPM